MLSSEDLEMLSDIQKYTYEIWYNPAMEIYHKIPEHRLTKDYLIPFLKKIGYSRYITRMIGVKFWQKPFMFVLYLLNDLRKIITHLLKYRFAVQSDLIAMCELTLFWSSLVSPFYLWKNRIYNRPLAKLQ